MAVITVKPGEFFIKNSQVAISEADLVHAEADDKWESGVLFIAGDPDNPDKTYRVVDTPEVIQAIKKGRLVLIEDGYASPLDDVPPSLEMLTVSQLRDLAAERGIDLTGITLKADIIAALTEE